MRLASNWDPSCRRLEVDAIIFLKRNPTMPNSKPPSLRQVLLSEGLSVPHWWDNGRLEGYGLSADCLRERRGSYVLIWNEGEVSEFRDPDKLREYVRDHKQRIAQQEKSE